ncbi:MAG TPA: translocation/assembly module TamB domain-containing protein, partial [Myxococcaceae bacterium]|nr:translocation/assembly module TamB domain-containing protein [Myxococcaceae bacterium]
NGRGVPVRRRRWLRWLGFGLLGLLGLILLVVVGGYAYLASKAGGERLTRLVTENANASIQGRLELGRVEYRGNRVVLHGVKLFDPEGDLVAEVARVEVAVSLGQLLSKRLEVSEALLGTPRLYLKQDERGLNLARAVASKKPKAPEPEARNAKQSTLSFAVDRLELRDGFLDFQQRADGDLRRNVRLEGLGAEGDLRLDRGGEALAANLSMKSSLTEPLAGPFEARLKADGEGEARSVDAAITVAGARLSARAKLNGTEQAHVDLRELSVDPETARAFLPSYPLLATARLSGTVERRGSQVETRLRGEAASARAEVNGAFDTATKRSPGLTVTLKGVNLAELIEEGPASDVRLELRAEGGGESLETLDAQLMLTAPESTMAGHAFGPVDVRASAKGGRFELSRLRANLPGLSLQASGQGTRSELNVKAHVEAHDLALLGRTLGKLAGPEGLPIAGTGALDVVAQGPVKHPSVAVRGGFPSLRYQDKSVQGLSLVARVPDVRVPQDARLRLQARTLALGDKRFRDVSAQVARQGAELTLRAATRGYADLALALTGTVDEDRKGLRLSSLQLRYPEATWRLAGPARVAFGNGNLRVEGFNLRSGRQSLSVDAWKRGSRMNASVAVGALDLGALPKVFVKPELKLKGRLTARLRATGTTARPQAWAQVELRDGRFKDYSDLSLSLEGRYAKKRAAGKLSASGVGVKLAADFDLPVKPLKSLGREPVRLDAHVQELRLKDVMETLGVEKPIDGFAKADLKISGTGDDPRVEVLAWGRAIRYERLPPSDLGFALASAQDGALTANLEVQTLDRHSRVELRTPFTVAGLIRDPPDKKALMRAPLELNADVQAFPLPVLYAAGLMDKEVLGTVSLQARVKGTALAPMGEARAALAGLAAGDLDRPLDVVVDLSTRPDGLRAEITATQDNRRVLDATARVEAHPFQLDDMPVLVRAPLSLKAHVGPLSLADLQAFTQTADVGQPPPPVRGIVDADLVADGTLADPRLRVRSRVEELCAASNAVGRVQLAYDYVDAKHVLDVLMKSANGGELKLAGNARLDVSYPALKRGSPDLDALPFDAELTSRDFDLSFLSGITPKIRALAGRLQANAKAGGTLGAPTARGDLEWTNGRLALAGYGDYEDLHVKLTGSPDRIELTDLSARNGDGTAKISALAQRTAGRFGITTKVNLDNFPIIKDDQLVANVTVRGDATGTLSAKQLDIKSLKIPEAHVMLPDVKRKNLQKLDEPRDVVLVRNGVPLKPPKVETGVGGSGEEPGMTVTVKVDAPRNIWIKGGDINTEVGFSDDFRVEITDRPYLFGDVHVRRGRVDVFGRRFDLQNDSLVRFTGPPTKPALDVTAQHENEREGVEVSLHVTGEVGEIKLQPTS